MEWTDIKARTEGHKLRRSAECGQFQLELAFMAASGREKNKRGKGMDPSVREDEEEEGRMRRRRREVTNFRQVGEGR
jgi:hypothetical protein